MADSKSVHGVVWMVCLFAAAVFVLILMALCMARPAHAESVPHQALAYRLTFIRNAHFVWGMDAPVATFASQIGQESGWNPEARSGVGAQGLAQFMPGTARDMGSRYADLSDVNAYNPAWAMRALLRYDQSLWRIFTARNDCQHMGKTLASYNSGPGWIIKMEKAARLKGLDAGVYFDVVEAMNVGRSAASDVQNRAYPRRIMFLYEPLYVRAGFGPGVAEGNACKSL
jgi:soluble lytic murein transglycosylase-like protein